MGGDRLWVRPAPDLEHSGSALLFELERLLRVLPGVIVAGVPTVARAIVVREKDRNQVLIEGTNLQVCEGGCACVSMTRGGAGLGGAAV